jgi:sulfur relay (sulfurtransferase) DsrC/TusE family protein
MLDFTWVDFISLLIFVHVLEETEVERDLGIYLNNRLNWDNQISHMKANAYGELSKLKRTFRHWNVMSFRILYCTYVRPKLEYCSSVWNPYNIENIEAIEMVQKNATKMIPQIRSMHYEDRLKAVGITTLFDRRLRGDLIQFYKIQNGLNLVSWIEPIKERPALKAFGPASSLRGSNHAIERQIVRNCEPRHWFLCNRFAPYWNALPAWVVNSITTNSFKNNLDKFLKMNKNFFTAHTSTIADGSR